MLLRIDFVLLALIPACNFCAFFLYIASAPAFIIDLLGLSSLSFAWLFVPMIVGIMTGAWMSGRFAGRFSPLRTIRLGYALMFAGVAINLVICWFAAPGVPLNVMPIMIFTTGSSLVMPSATLILLDLFPAFRGMASSVQGFLQFTLSGSRRRDGRTVRRPLPHDARRWNGGIHAGGLCPVAHLPIPCTRSTERLATMIVRSLIHRALPVIRCHRIDLHLVGAARSARRRCQRLR